MATKTKTARVTDAELALLQELRAGRGMRELEAFATQTPVAAPVEGTSVSSTTADKAHADLANAFASAIERTRPPEKKNVFTRRKNNPWSPPGDTPKLKMKRKMLHHGIPITKVNNEEIALLNKIRPGNYCEGFVRVTLRKDRGIDIDHPVKTSSQRLQLMNKFGIGSFTQLLQRIIAEYENPKQYRTADDPDLYDIG